MLFRSGRAGPRSVLPWLAVLLVVLRRRRRRGGVALVAAAAALALAGCNTKTLGGGSEGRPCNLGEMAFCTCPNGKQSTQGCGSNGVFLDCACGQTPVGPPGGGPVADAANSNGPGASTARSPSPADHCASRARG